MRLAYPALVLSLIVLSAPAASATRGGEGRGALPSLDIESGCRDVANNNLNKTSDFSGCLSNERAASDELRREWASYSGDMHDQCLHLVTPPALPSYVTLQQCLRMSRDAREMTKTDGASQTGKTMQSPSKN